MHKFLVGVALGALIFGIVVHAGRAQVATTNVRANEIRQGDILNMDVSVDRAPNFDGTLSVRVSPEGDNDPLTLSCNLSKDATTCQMGNRIPLEAKVGKWTIRKITFQTLAQAPEKELAKSGDLSFRVVSHGDVILPNSATVSGIK